MSTFLSGRLEARGLTANSADFRGLESFLSSLHRAHREASAAFHKRPASSYTNSASTKSSFPNHKHYHKNYNSSFATTNDDANDGDNGSPSAIQTSTRNTSAPTPQLLLRYLNPKEMKLDLNDNEQPNGVNASSTYQNGFVNNAMRPYHRTAQSAGATHPSTKRQIAAQCGIKTFSFDGRRWKNENNSVSTSTGKGQIVFQGPQNGNQSRRGLRGSKVRPGASTPRPTSQGRSKLDSLEPSPLGYRESTVISSPSPRNLSISSLQHSQTSLNLPVADSEEGPESVDGYGWNASDQGLRLQKHLSAKSSIRSMRRVSEMVNHRLDPMYKISGSKVTLQDRYCVDGVEMQKLQEMTITREELLSDLRKMKFHQSGGSYTNQVNAQKHKLLQQNISRLQQQQGNPSIYPSTPASDPTTARNPNNDNNNYSGDAKQKQKQQQQPLSQQSEDDILDIIDDDDDGGDDEDEFNDNNIIREEVDGVETTE